MKKFLPVLFSLTVILIFAGCSNTTENNENISTETSDASKNNSTNEQNKSQIDIGKENTVVKNTITMNITVGSSTFTATLEENNTAKAFVKQLPLTVEMSELNGNEKFNYLSSDLREDTASSPGRIDEGDLMLYGNNCLVLFYKKLNTSYSYVKLGRIDNTKGLTEAVGSGNVKVTFSASK